MTTKKKVLLTIGLAVLNAVAVYGLIYYIQNLIETVEILQTADPFFQQIINNEKKILFTQTIFTMFMLANVIIYTVLLFIIWKKKFKSLKYSYIDYKNEKEEKIKQKNIKLLKKTEEKKKHLEDKIKKLNS